MIDINKAFTIVFNGTQSILEKAGFSAALPDGYKKGDLPLNTEDNITYMQFSNGETLLSMQLDEIKKTFSLFTADAPQDAVDDPEFQSLSTWGFDIKEADDRDANSVANDFCDIIRTKYAPDAVSASDTRVKMPQTISKNPPKTVTACMMQKCSQPASQPFSRNIKTLLKKTFQNTATFSPKHSSQPMPLRALSAL